MEAMSWFTSATTDAAGEEVRTLESFVIWVAAEVVELATLAAMEAIMPCCDFKAGGTVSIATDPISAAMSAACWKSDAAEVNAATSPAGSVPAASVGINAKPLFATVFGFGIHRQCSQHIGALHCAWVRQQIRRRCASGRRQCSHCRGFRRREVRVRTRIGQIGCRVFGGGFCVDPSPISAVSSAGMAASVV